MLATQTDEALFLSYRDQGNAEALSTLYGRYANLVLFVMDQKGLPLADAEDVVHDAWHSALTKGQQFRARGLFRSWFVSIVLNRASSYLRQRHCREQLLMRSGKRTASNALDMFINCDWFRTTLGRLPACQRECLTLSYVDCLSLRQVAGQLGIAPSTVGRHISRAIETLKGPLI